MDTTFLTIGVALGLSGIAALTVLTGRSDDDSDGPFGTFVLIIAALYGASGAYLLLDPAAHLKGLDNLSNFGTIAAALVLLPVAFDAEHRSTKDGVMAVMLCSMIGAIATKAEEQHKPGPQQDLHTANIWLLILSALVVVVFLVVSLWDAKKRVDASVAPTPRVLESPIDCHADPEHMRLHHGSDSTADTTVAPAPDTGGKPNLHKEF